MTGVLLIVRSILDDSVNTEYRIFSKNLIQARKGSEVMKLERVG